MPFDMQGARAAGYSDAEIASFLGKQVGFDTDAAVKAGYKPDELVPFLTERAGARDNSAAEQPSVADQPAQGDPMGSGAAEIANAPFNQPEAGAGRGFVNPSAVGQTSAGDIASRVARNAVGSVGAGVADMAQGAGMLTLAPAQAVDFVDSLVTGRTHTEAVDFAAKHFVDPNVSAADRWAPKPEEQPDIAEKVVNGLMRLAPSLAVAVGTSGASAEPAIATGLQAVRQAVAQGMRSMSVPAFSAGITRAADLIRQGAPITEAIRSGLTEGATTDLTGGVAMSAPGARVLTRAVQGAAVGATTGDVARQAQNLAAPDYQTERTPEQVAVSALTGAVLGAGTPHAAARVIRAEDVAPEPPAAAPRADVGDVLHATSIDDAIAAADVAVRPAASDGDAMRDQMLAIRPLQGPTLEQELAALRRPEGTTDDSATPDLSAVAAGADRSGVPESAAGVADRAGRLDEPANAVAAEPAAAGAPDVSVPPRDADAVTSGVADPAAREAQIAALPASEVEAKAAQITMRRNDSGTVAVLGDPGAVSALLRAHDVPFIPSREGALVGRTNADAAEKVVSDFAPSARAPEAVDAGQEAASTVEPLPEAKPAERFPRVDAIESMAVGPSSVRVRPIAPGQRLYRETNAAGLDDMLRSDRQFDVGRTFVADNPDIALGQGENKGVTIQFRPDSLSGMENRKPGTGDVAGREYVADIRAARAVERVTFAKPETELKTRGLTRRVLKQEFDRERLADGRIEYTRKGLDVPPAADELATAGSERAADANHFELKKQTPASVSGEQEGPDSARPIAGAASRDGMSGDTSETRASEDRKLDNQPTSGDRAIVPPDEGGTGETPLFKRSEIPGRADPMVEQVRQQLAEPLSRLIVPHTIHPTIKAAREATGVDIPDDAKGMHYDGKIHLFAEALRTKLHAEVTLWHEVQHAGLIESFGRGKEYEGALRDISLKNRNVRDAAKAWMTHYGQDDYNYRVQHGMSPERAMVRTKLQALDEALADLSGRNAQINGLAKFIAKAQQLMRALGFHKLANYIEGKTDAEALSLILRSRSSVMRDGNEGRASVETAPSFIRDTNASLSRASADSPDLPEEVRKPIGAYHVYDNLERVPRESSGGIADSIAKALVPAGREGAIETGGIIRANLAEQARGREMAQQKLMEFAKRFDAMPVKDNYAFIDAMERGIPQKNAELDRAAVALRKALDERRDQVRALGKGALENFNQNYFPHIWKDKTSASNFFTRRPLEGGKGFLKQRTYDYFSDGLKAGLEPITTNPVELALLKAREMDRYIYGQRIFAEMKQAGVAKFVRFGDKAPEGWQKINDKIARVTQYSEAEKGMVLRGEYYAPEQAATLINNHLSPGLSGIAAFDMIRRSGNIMNSTQLGLSAYHLGFTTLDAMTSKAALGIKQATRGDIVKGTGNVLQSLNPAQPFLNLFKGDRLLKAYMGNINDPDLAPIVEALVQGGGRVKMDDVYRNAAVNEFRQAIRKGQYATAALKSIPRLLDLTTAPIFQWLVPRQKLGVFFDMAKDALEKNPEMSLQEKRQVMGKLWDSVDNRMGEMVYDNVFWNRALKDALMVSVRSVGWNLGTFREIGGGIKDIKDIPKLGGLSDRTSYIFGLTFIAAVLGSITQYLYTGEGPKELKDVFFPRTGKTRPDGTDDRLSLPSYMKDIYEYGHDIRNFAKYGDNPFNTLGNKLHPLISTLVQIFTNKDFFGGAIRSPGDEPMQQAVDEAKYMLKQMTPFSLRNYMQQAKLKGEEPSVGGYLSSPSMIGITPSPGYITKSDEQAESSQVNKMRESLVTKFREEMRDGAEWPEVRQRAMDAGLRGQDLTFIRKAAEQRPPKRLKEFANH